MIAVEATAGGQRVVLSGRWTLAATAPQAGQLAGRLAAITRQPVAAWDLAGIEALDSAGAMLLWHAWQGRLPSGMALRPEFRTVFARLAAAAALPQMPAPPVLSWRRVRRLGAVTLGFGGHVRDLVALIGQVALDGLHCLRHPADIPWKETSATLYKAGVTAMPVAALVGLLIGIALSYLSALQLRQLGADVFIVNVLGLGIIRELGPMLVAVLIAGRSGSAMTAQLGVMRVTEEIDALAAMGVSRTLRLVLPKVVALALLFALEQLKVDEIRSPELTGNWEYKLKEMEHGRLKREEFMAHIVEQTQLMVERIKTGEFADPDFGTLKSPCPKCGGKIHEGYKHFTCEKCDYKLWKVVASRQWEPEEVDDLLAKRQIGPLQGFRSKMGRAFAAVIKLDENHAPSFDFGNDNEEAGEAVDLSAAEKLGACPKCGSTVYDQPMAYVCEKSIGAAKTCDFRSGKVILQQEVSKAEMQKLLETGRTSLLKGFVSNRTRRKFSAYLVRGQDGKVGFEFEARKAAPRAAPKTAAKAEKVDAGGTAAAKAPTKAKAPRKTTAKKAG